MLNTIINKIKNENKEKIKKAKEDIAKLRTMLSEFEKEPNLSEEKRVVRRYSLDLDTILALDGADVLFYITRCEDFFTKQIVNMSDDEIAFVLNRALSEIVVKNSTVDYLNWAFSLYAERMTDEQLKRVVKAIIAKSHDNFVMYRIMASKLFEMGKTDILEIVLKAITERFGEIATKEIKENLIK